MEKIKQKTVVAQVMDRIKDLIASGQYKSGDKLPTEAELAERFGIGRSSIRQAINIFNYLGVLKSKASLGTFVQERAQISTEVLTWSLILGKDELEEMVDLRGSIEQGCILDLTLKMEEPASSANKTIQSLEDIVLKMEIAAKKGDMKKLVDLDFTFHYTIIQDDRNQLYLSLYNTLKSFLYDEIKKTQMNYGKLELIPAEHRKIIEAVKSGRQAEALAAFQAHIRNIKYKLNQ